MDQYAESTGGSSIKIKYNHDIRDSTEKRLLIESCDLEKRLRDDRDDTTFTEEILPINLPS